MLSSLSQAGANPATERMAAPLVPAQMAHPIGYATTAMMAATNRGPRDRRRPPVPTVRPIQATGDGPLRREGCDWCQSTSCCAPGKTWEESREQTAT